MVPPAADPLWLSAPEEAAWRTLLGVQRQLLGRLDAELREAHDLTLADYDVLVVLSEAAGSALRMGDLADRVALSPSGLTRRVDRLERRGLVRRRSCPSDGRGALATLAEPGRELLAAAAPTHLAGVRRYLVDRLGEAELTAVAGALGRVVEGLAGPPTSAVESGSGGVGADRRAAVRAQSRSEPSTTGRPDATQALVPPETDTAR